MFNRLSLRAKLSLSFTLIIILLLLLSGFAWYAIHAANIYSDHQAGQQNIVINAEDLKRQVFTLRFEAMRGFYCKDIRAKDPKNPTPEEGSYRYFLEKLCGDTTKESMDVIEKIKNNLNHETEKEEIESCARAIDGLKEYETITTDWANIQDKILDSATLRLGQANKVRDAVIAILERVAELIERDKKPVEDKNGDTLKDKDGNIVQYVPERLVGRQQRLAYVMEQIERLRRLTREQITITGVEAMKAKNAEIDAVFKDLDNRINILVNEFTTAASKADAETARDYYQAWQKEIKNYGDLVLQQNAIFARMGEIAGAIVTDTDKILEAAKEMAVKAGKDFDTNNFQAMIMIFSISGFAIFCGIVLGLWLSANIAGATSKITNLLGLVVDQGDITVRVEPELLRRGDEVGQLSRTVENIVGDYVGVSGLAKALSDGDWTVLPNVKSEQDDMNLNLKAMIEKINETLSNVADAVNQVATGAREIASAGETLANGATESAASIEEITASMSEMGGQTGTNAKNAGEASQLAKQASGAGTSGQEMMNRMITSMQEITRNAQDVQKVIKVIDDISFQTNLLALNAAVEAARAGVHGKGFAVVAEEVRNLAARCAKAAGETTRMIEGNNRQINAGAEIASETADMLNQIVEFSSKTSELIERIAVASNEQAQGIAQVTQGLQQIDSVTQQNTASAEETASVASEMSSQSAKLQEQIAFFRLQS